MAESTRYIESHTMKPKCLTCGSEIPTKRGVMWTYPEMWALCIGLVAMGIVIIYLLWLTANLPGGDGWK